MLLNLLRLHREMREEYEGNIFRTKSAVVRDFARRTKMTKEDLSSVFDGRFYKDLEFVIKTAAPDADEPCCHCTFTTTREGISEDYLRRIREDPDVWLVDIRKRIIWPSAEYRRDGLIYERDLETRFEKLNDHWFGD